MTDIIRIAFSLTRSTHRDFVPAPGESLHQMPQGHRDAIDLRRKGFGDEREFQPGDSGEHRTPPGNAKHVDNP